VVLGFKKKNRNAIMKVNLKSNNPIYVIASCPGFFLLKNE
jgi:hypothetical protein